MSLPPRHFHLAFACRVPRRRGNRPRCHFLVYLIKLKINIDGRYGLSRVPGEKKLPLDDRGGRDERGRRGTEGKSCTARGKFITIEAINGIFLSHEPAHGSRARSQHRAHRGHVLACTHVHAYTDGSSVVCEREKRGLCNVGRTDIKATAENARRNRPAVH